MFDANRPVALVTGASAGIGKATARQLLELGWQVIGTGRNAARCMEAEQELTGSGPGKFHMLRGDFDHMADVKRLADEVVSLTSRLDVLINNAGGVRDRQIVTPEGLEATFAANHLSAFFLTRELLPLMEVTASQQPAGSVRVIAVSSSAHRVSEGMNFDDLQSLQNFMATPAYCQAKLANILFTRELARNAAAKGIVALVMHPGIVHSNFASHGDSAMQSYMAAADTAPPDEPAETLVWLATAAEPASLSGRYFYGKEEEVPSDAARDDAAAFRLWAESERLLKASGL